MFPFFKKPWISPFMACSFLIIAVSGILMFFHVKTGALIILHEWIGLFFIVAAVLHIVLNWRAFLSYLMDRKAAVSIIAALTLSFLLMVTGILSDGGHDSHRGHPNPKGMIRYQ